MQNPLISQQKNWYAMYTKPRHEFKSVTQLNAAGIENYLPTITKTRQWSDRKKKVDFPLFSGYIFVHGNERDRLIALEQQSVVRSIFFEGKPAIVPDWQIENLKKMLERGTDISVTETLAIGSRVKIISGPFKDVEGIVYENANQDKILAITIDLLRRSVIVKIPKESVIEAQ
ncbi:MAG: UpxY family transcription antiterminator [Ignavibacteriae bacterium]|nr:UpxY family transcription antiterminator [Ignavibacteriota bacterium]